MEFRVSSKIVLMYGKHCSKFFMDKGEDGKLYCDKQIKVIRNNQIPFIKGKKLVKLISCEIYYASVSVKRKKIKL